MDSRATHVADRAARDGGGDHARPKSADIADPPFAYRPIRFLTNTCQ